MITKECKFQKEKKKKKNYSTGSMTSIIIYLSIVQFV